MFIKLPYKIEPKNICDIIKECFGIENYRREKREVVQLEEIIIHEEPQREKTNIMKNKKERIEKREQQIKKLPKIKKIYRERLDIPVNKYLMVDASTNTDDLENEVLSFKSSKSPEYVLLD